MNNRLRNIRHIALDMDGTIYSGGTLFEATAPFLALLGELGIGYTFLTNNSSKSLKDYLAHLRNFGIEAAEDQLYTSTQATLAYLREELPAVRRLFVLGTTSMQQEMAAAGFELTKDDPTDEPEAVVVGFDTTQPTVLVDCGSICAALAQATGRTPQAVLGKPDPRMIRGIAQRHSLTPEHLAMVGDRLYTDLAMARRAGVLGVLVLTGETTATVAARHSPPPDLVVASLAEFGAQLRAAQRDAIAS